MHWAVVPIDCPGLRIRIIQKRRTSATHINVWNPWSNCRWLRIKSRSSASFNVSTADRPNTSVLKTRQAPGESFSQVPAPARLAAAAGERRRRLGTTWWRWGLEPTAARPHFSTSRYKRSSRRLSAEFTGRWAAHFSMFWNTRQSVVAPPSELRTMAGSRFGGRGGDFGWGCE